MHQTLGYLVVIFFNSIGCLPVATNVSIPVYANVKLHEL